MKKLIILFLVLFLSINLNLFSQVSQQWATRYNGSSNGSDYANDIKIDLAGNIIVTGTSQGSNDLNYMTIKYNSAGVQQWIRTYDGLQGEDVAEAVAVDFSGNVFVTGRSSVSGSGFNFYTQKMNSSGTVLWGTYYNGPGNGDDKAHAIVVDALGNVYVGGVSTGSGTGPDFCLVKYNAAGVQQWAYRYNAPANSWDELVDFKIDAAGNNLYLTGFGNYGAPDYSDYVTIKVNSAGTQQWIKRYNGGGSDQATSITVDASGNSYVTGWFSDANSWESYSTVKYNSAGTQIWFAHYDGPGQRIDIPADIETDASGNVFVTGRSQGANLLYDFATVKYNSSGAQQWANRWIGIGSNQYSYASALELDAAGNVYVGGYSGASAILLDYAVVRYSNAGAQQWWIKYNGPAGGNDIISSIVLDGSANVYVTGSSAGSGTGNDMATIKYSQTVGIQPVSNELPEKFELSQNYPNPFNPATTINFQLPESGFVKLTVFDALGNLVDIIANEYFNAGYYTAEFKAEKLSSGVYFYKIETENFQNVKKMMLIK
ncbi:MAG: SBBP repeat-containing protein [Ignavibacteria bacterium]|nr:SBBP repeat-containing protein [Ignavibacteria bacterium]